MKKIELTGKYGKGKFALVDDDDYHRLLMYNYCIGKAAKHPKWKSFSVVRGVRSRPYKMQDTILLAEDILNVQTNKDEVVLFKNRNPLDFRKQNIEIVPLSVARAWVQREFQPTSSKKHSKYRGVCRTQNGKRWRGFISKRKNGKVKQHAKTFDTEIEAAKWRDEMAIKLYGKGYCYLNFD